MELALCEKQPEKKRGAKTYSKLPPPRIEIFRDYSRLQGLRVGFENLGPKSQSLGGVYCISTLERQLRCRIYDASKLSVNFSI